MRRTRRRQQGPASRSSEVGTSGVPGYTVVMSTIPDPTLQTTVQPTQQFPTAPPGTAAPLTAPVEVRGSSTASSTSGSSPLHDVRPEDPKRNPITYVALGIALLALLLSLLALTRDNGPNQIDVGGKRCIVDRIEGNEADTLFCQS